MLAAGRGVGVPALVTWSCEALCLLEICPWSPFWLAFFKHMLMPPAFYSIFFLQLSSILAAGVGVLLCHQKEVVAIDFRPKSSYSDPHDTPRQNHGIQALFQHDLRTLSPDIVVVVCTSAFCDVEASGVVEARSGLARTARHARNSRLRYSTLLHALFVPKLAAGACQYFIPLFWRAVRSTL